MEARRFAILTPYFGELPNSFQLFAESCRPFPEIDFYLLTDSRRRPEVPPNVKFLDLTLADFERIAADRLGVSVRLSCAYKLCDFKPMLGLLFDDLLAPYDYWGYGDIDQVLSITLREALSETVAGDYDVFNSDIAIMHAPFVLLKNSRAMRELFQSSRDWQRALEDPQYRGFDEVGKKWVPLWKLAQKHGSHDRDWGFLKMEAQELLALEDFECFTTVVNREVAAGRLRVLCRKGAKEYLAPGERIWIKPEGICDDRGRVYDFYHWVADKHRRTFTYPGWKKVPSRYYVTRSGFYDADTPGRNLMLALFRWARGATRLIRDRTTFHLHRYLGITLDERWRVTEDFR
jgi:hypothetical protein